MGRKKEEEEVGKEENGEGGERKVDPICRKILIGKPIEDRKYISSCQGLGRRGNKSWERQGDAG